MIIIVEGADGSGKTTLARELVRQLGDRAEYIHLTRPEHDQWSYATARIARAVALHLLGYTVVFDRLWVSDNVYDLMGPHPGRSLVHVRRQDSVLQRYGTYYVLCAPDPSDLVVAYDKLADTRAELYGKNLKGMRAVAQTYWDLWRGAEGRYPLLGHYVDQQIELTPWRERPLVTRYDRFEETNVKRWAKTFLATARLEVQPFYNADPLSPADPDHWNLSGSLLTCRALLVGEQVPHPDEFIKWPFYSNVGSAAYLTYALHRAKISETDVALVNARGPVTVKHNTLTQVTDWLTLRRPEVRVVALGRTAERTLDYMPIAPVATLPHPQHARRFNHHGDYHKRLREAIYGDAGRSGATDILQRAKPAARARPRRVAQGGAHARAGKL